MPQSTFTALENEIFRDGNPLVTGDRLGVLNAAVQKIHAQKTAGRGGNIKIVRGNIFDERAAAGPAFDVNGASSGVCEFAMLNPHITDAAGGFAPDADAGKIAVGERATGNQNILGRFRNAITLHAAAGFEGDAVVARVNVARFDADIFAGVHVNTVAVAAGAADEEIFRNYIFAVNGVD